MAAATKRDDTNLSRRFGRGSDNEVIALQLNLLGKGEGVTFKKLRHNIFGIVHEFFHDHDNLSFLRHGMMAPVC